MRPPSRTTSLHLTDCAEGMIVRLRRRRRRPPNLGLRSCGSSSFSFSSSCSLVVDHSLSCCCSCISLFLQIIVVISCTNTQYEEMQQAACGGCTAARCTHVERFAASRWRACCTFYTQIALNNNRNQRAKCEDCSRTEPCRHCFQRNFNDGLCFDKGTNFGAASFNAACWPASRQTRAPARRG